MVRKHSALLAAAMLTLAAPAGARKETKAPDLSHFAFWTAKGHSVQPFTPGLNGVLLLSDQQRVELEAARAETLGSKEFREASRLLKRGSGATEAQKLAAGETVGLLKARFRDRVAAVLTPEQKGTILHVNDLYAAVAREVREAARAEFAASKADKARTAAINAEVQARTHAAFRARLKQSLTAEQWAALEAAAAQERAAESAAAARKAVRKAAS